MANSVIQLFGYTLSFLGLVGLIIATLMDEWKSNAYANNEAVRTNEIYTGLWKDCSKGSTDNENCKRFSSIFHAPADIQVARVGMITGLLLCGTAALVSLAGLGCTTCLEDNRQLKTKVAVAGGVLFILGGLCAFAIVSWFAGEIARTFRFASKADGRFVFGTAVYVGWSAGFLCVAGGAFLCCCSGPLVKLNKFPNRSPTPTKPASDYV